VNGFTCAVKILDVSLSVKDTIDNFLREIRILEQLSHTNIVRYLGHDMASSKLRLFMEYYPYTLSKVIDKRKSYFPMKELVRMLLQIAQGLLHMHQQTPPIIYRDMKTSNVLVALGEQEDVKEAKLTDFDSSKIMNQGLAFTVIGTPQYTAPEVFSGKGYNTQADIWSYGLLIYECLTLKPPFMDIEPQRLLGSVKEGIKPTLPDDLKADKLRSPVLEVMNKCLVVDPNQRLTGVGLVEELEKIQDQLDNKISSPFMKGSSDSDSESTEEKKKKKKKKANLDGCTQKENY